MIVARLVRASFLKIREQEFIQAARSYGASNGRLVLVHILPGALGPILVAAHLRVAEAILTETALSFLGLRVPAADPELGQRGRLVAQTTIWSYILDHRLPR